MKPILYFLIFICLCIGGCKKDDSFFVASLNGNAWNVSEKKAVMHTNNSGLIDITFLNILEPEGRSEYLAFLNIKPEVGTKTVAKLKGSVGYGQDTCSSFFLTITDGGCVGLENYAIDEASNGNYLFIDSYDETTGRITGRFQATYFNNDLHIENWLPERLEFTDGRFDLIIQ